MKISKYWKAVVAGGAAGCGALATALGDDVVTAGDWWTLAGAVAAALGFTWAVPNREPKDSA